MSIHLPLLPRPRPLPSPSPRCSHTRFFPFPELAKLLPAFRFLQEAFPLEYPSFRTFHSGLFLDTRVSGEVLPSQRTLADHQSKVVSVDCLFLYFFPICLPPACELWEQGLLCLLSIVFSVLRTAPGSACMLNTCFLNTWRASQACCTQHPSFMGGDKGFCGSSLLAGVDFNCLSIPGLDKLFWALRCEDNCRTQLAPSALGCQPLQR